VLLGFLSFYGIAVLKPM